MSCIRRGLVFASLLAIPVPAILHAQLEPPSTGGTVALAHDLKRLGHYERVLLIAAHPDDEDTELLTLLVRGMGADGAYLALNRGEGGQNLIGEELGEALGLLRTEELLAARRLDGAQQFFTRAYDFGFSKSLDDTWAHWPRDSVLKDVVRIVRRFRPQIVVSIFSGTPRDGHAQHQAAGWAAQEAFRVAGDSGLFPELATEEGLLPWTPLKLYRSTRFDSTATTLTLDGGALDPAVGQSYHQIAMRGRSLHRSQDMGQLQRMGPSAVRLQLLVDRTGAGGEGLWSGLDTTLAGTPLVAGLKPEARRQVASALARYAARVDSARAALAPDLRDRLRDLLARASDDLGAARSLVLEQGRGDPRRFPARDPVLAGDPFEGEFARLGVVRLRSLDLVVDGFSSEQQVAPGQSLRFTASLWNAGDTAVAAATCLGSPRFRWRVADSAIGGEIGLSPRRGVCLGVDAASTSLVPLARGNAPLPPGRVASAQVEAQVRQDEAYTTPYFLREPRAGSLYRWDPGSRAQWGLPFEDPPFVVEAQVPLDGEFARDQREIALRGNDQASGEFRRPVSIVPRVDVRLDPEEEVWPLGRGTPRTFTLTLTHGASDTTAGTVALTLPRGWPAPPAQPFRLTGDHDQAVFRFTVRPPAGLRPGGYEIGALARDRQGRVYDVGLRTVSHPHIHARSYAVRAAATVRAADLALPRLRRVAYLRGAADRVPEALSAVGIPIQPITGADLARSDLSGFDAIVIGSRAYETDPDLPAATPQLLRYARAGGLVIVQYQQYAYFLGNFAPFPMTVGSRAPGAVNSTVVAAPRPGTPASPALLGGHDRVTDETASVTAVDPASPVLRTPNRIGRADWDDWVQERGLYFAHGWASEWKPVLEMHDPGEPPLRGGLLVARVGRGTYVYTGLSFFRQLPAGVPGAYRLFANLLALGERRGTTSRRAAPADSAKVERQ